MLGSLPFLAVQSPVVVEISWLLVLPALRLVAWRFEGSAAAAD